jgi:hypothetical protein
VALLLAGCTSQPVLVAARGTPELDGKLHEPVWRTTAATGPWKGTEIVAYAEARVLWDDRFIYLGLLCADENVGADDVVEVNVGDAHRLVRPSDPEVDVDGTFGKPDDFDEEWTAELTFPRNAATELDVSFMRRDTPKGASERVSRWSGKVKLKP